jgi:hypothetical protein
MRDVTQWVSRARVLDVQHREESPVHLYHAMLLTSGREDASADGCRSRSLA